MRNLIIGVIAPKGSGKSYMVAKTIQRIDRVAVFDIVHENAYLVCEPYIGQPAAFARAIAEPQFKCAYRPVDFQIEGDRITCPSFEPIITACYLRGNMTFIIDEAHLLCNARSAPAMLMTANFIGRHRRLNIIYVAQSFSAVTRPLTRNTDEFWFWRNIEPSDLQGIAERCGMETRDRVANLRKLEEHQDESVTPGEMLRWNVWNGICDGETDRL